MEASSGTGRAIMLQPLARFVSYVATSEMTFFDPSRTCLVQVMGMKFRLCLYRISGDLCALLVTSRSAASRNPIWLSPLVGFNCSKTVWFSRLLLHTQCTRRATRRV